MKAFLEILLREGLLVLWAVFAVSRFLAGDYYWFAFNVAMFVVSSANYLVYTLIKTMKASE
ncbi:hypothetical protein [Metabacillus litoralis]|uniref:hypothetical protein n=1 Tax=Metabacillus litoralis TaxID=152268 RepID=UPI00203D614B|nr:hypothetical protein [Metabacillus litoralis]MCM3411880.1 hypothetical protein [Metabacillus litoralis]